VNLGIVDEREGIAGDLECFVRGRVVLDLGAWLRYARTELRYEKIVLVGWSGGG